MERLTFKHHLISSHLLPNILLQKKLSLSCRWTGPLHEAALAVASGGLIIQHKGVIIHSSSENVIKLK